MYKCKCMYFIFIMVIWGMVTAVKGLLEARFFTGKYGIIPIYLNSSG